ncbi:hypothetical protein ACIP5N_21800 [Streptomyces sp. NPDC088768]|uniref:hypothetical protein n=1 Tax=Streptomyces sp. NPDC088768 TaxID=3365894 RepID=UPI003830C73B
MTNRSGSPDSGGTTVGCLTDIPGRDSSGPTATTTGHHRAHQVVRMLERAA